MSKVYPKRPYAGPAEVAQGDVVRMRHEGELHGGHSPSFDDAVIAELIVDGATGKARASLRRPHLYVHTDGTVHTRVEAYDVAVDLLVERFDVLTSGASGEKESRMKYQLFETGYYTVLIPWSDTPTKWHPTDKDGPFAVLTRGAFRCTSEAEEWAKEALEGQPFTVKRIAGVPGIDPTVKPYTVTDGIAD
jgi:hypothetical protein